MRHHPSVIRSGMAIRNRQNKPSECCEEHVIRERMLVDTKVVNRKQICLLYIQGRHITLIAVQYSSFPARRRLSQNLRNQDPFQRAPKIWVIRAREHSPCSWFFSFTLQ